MCGIAGVIGEGSARPMIEQLVHRGPDGVRVEDHPGLSLAHARLSIIDLEGGWQPLSAAGSTVIGNGEIYNYLELTQEFGLADRLATGSDFEPLLHLYALEGEAAFQRLRGMYAFCLIGGDGRSWLVRDPFGIKPLYRRGGAFASEPRALERRPVLEAGAAEELLTLGYTLQSAWSGVRRLQPGEIVLASPPPCGEGVGGGGVSAGLAKSGAAQHALESHRPTPPPQPLPAKGRGFSLIDRVDSVLEDSVRVHQRSDVPYGLFLSGGIDSAVIATLMARLNTRPVTAFTCGFDAPGAADERAGAEAVARALDLDWRETSFGEADFWRILPRVAWALDDPTTDYATLPTYKLAEAAKGTLTVVLTGEGGDELFAGYGRYRRALRPRWLGGRDAAPRPVAHELADGGAAAVTRWRQATAPETPGLSRLQKAQWGDIAGWLPNDLLLKLDRCLMAHGLEGRTPFLDREVAAFAFNLPDRMKVRGRHGKWLLRKWLERACPAARPWARKQGFTVPVAAWIAPRAADLGPRIAEVEAVRALCAPDRVRAVFAGEAHAQRRWPLLFFAVWARIHLEGAAPDDALGSIIGTI